MSFVHDTCLDIYVIYIFTSLQTETVSIGSIL